MEPKLPRRPGNAEGVVRDLAPKKHSVASEGPGSSLRAVRDDPAGHFQDRCIDCVPCGTCPSLSRRVVPLASPAAHRARLRLGSTALPPLRVLVVASNCRRFYGSCRSGGPFGAEASSSSRKRRRRCPGPRNRKHGVASGSSGLSLRRSLKARHRGGPFDDGGEGGIRTLGTGLPYTRFPGEPIRPLWHLSENLATHCLLAPAFESTQGRASPIMRPEWFSDRLRSERSAGRILQPSPFDRSGTSPSNLTLLCRSAPAYEPARGKAGWCKPAIVT